MAETTIRIEHLRLRVPAFGRDAAARLASDLGPAIVERLAPSAVGASPGRAWVARVEVPPIRSVLEPAALCTTIARAVADGVSAKLPAGWGRR